MESLGARNAVVKTLAANKAPLAAKSSARGGAVVVRASARKDEEGNNKNTAVAGEGGHALALPQHVSKTHPFPRTLYPLPTFPTHTHRRRNP